MGRKIEFTIPESYDNKRVISFLRSEAKLSSRLIRTLKHYDEGITLNSVHTRTVDIMHTGDILAVDIPCPDGEIEPVEMPLDILYEDDDLVIINKSPFLAIHPTHNHQGDTLANALVYHLENEGKPTMFRAVGRLDKGTSGIVICALNKHCASMIPKSVEKEYYAVVNGKLEKKGTIDAPIYRPDPMKTLRAVGENGDRAVTHWTVIKQNEEISYVRVNLETGRTHQIRVHFKSLGMPLVGDYLYSEPGEIGHQLLHCGKITFVHPVTGEKITVTAPPPADMQMVIDSI